MVPRSCVHVFCCPCSKCLACCSFQGAGTHPVEHIVINSPHPPPPSHVTALALLCALQFFLLLGATETMRRTTVCCCSYDFTCPVCATASHPPLLLPRGVLGGQDMALLPTVLLPPPISATAAPSRLYMGLFCYCKTLKSRAKGKLYSF